MDRGGDFKVVYPPPNDVKQNKTSLGNVKQGDENDDDLSFTCHSKWPHNSILVCMCITVVHELYASNIKILRKDINIKKIVKLMRTSY